MATAAAGKGANGRVLKVLDATLSVDITEADTYVGTGVAFYIPAGVIVTGFFIVAGAPGGTAAAGAKTINYSIGTVANADADLTDATDIDVMHASGEKTAASVHGDVAADYGTDGGDWFNGTIDAHSKYVDAYTTLQLNYIGKCAAGGGHVDGTVTCAFKVYAIMDMLPL
jgi:hypothetical protein